MNLFLKKIDIFCRNHLACGCHRQRFADFVFLIKKYQSPILQHGLNIVWGLHRLIPLNKKPLNHFPGWPQSPLGTHTERTWHQQAVARGWGHQHAVSVSPRLPKPFNYSMSQTSWQALCCRKTRCLKLATAVIVGSSSKPNRGIRQCKESPGVLIQPDICEEYVMPETAEVSLTWLRWSDACRASSKWALSWVRLKIFWSQVVLHNVLFNLLRFQSLCYVADIQVCIQQLRIKHSQTHTLNYPLMLRPKQINKSPFDFVR